MPDVHTKLGSGSTEVPAQRELPLPGSLDCDLTLRMITSQAIKNSSLSREQIADEMSVLTGQKITDQMLYCWTAESKEKHRFPAVYLPAFCAVTNDSRLLEALAQKLNLLVLGAEEARLIELGRAVEQERAAVLRREHLLSGGSR